MLERALGPASFDLEAVEGALRAAVLLAGGRLLGKLLERVGSGRRGVAVVCRCGERMESRGRNDKALSTMLGEVSWRRSVFRCPVCGATRCPGDEELDVVGTGYSPGLRRMMARAGSKTPFREASEDLDFYAGVKVSAKAVERESESVGEDIAVWCESEHESSVRQYEQENPYKEKTIRTLYIELDGTGVPMVRYELAGRRGRQPDGSARTREVKVGCVFTQTAVDEKGRAVRDPDSTTYIGKIERAADFGHRLFAEAVRRGLSQAERVVILGDGAPWIRNIVETHFPGAIFIIDVYHAREHVAALAKELYPHNEKKISLYRERWWDYLDHGNVEKIAREAQRRLRTRPEQAKKAQIEIGYLMTNKERMRYDKFRSQGMFIGSGVIEAACGRIIGHRLKQSGMEWSLRGANSIISLRCAQKSARLDDYWEQRAA